MWWICVFQMWPCIVIRPYCNVIGELRYYTLVLPSYEPVACLVTWCDGRNFMSGRIHRSENILLTLVLPSLNRITRSACWDQFMSGRLHRVVIVYTLVLPSVISGIVFVFSDFWFVQMSGRIHRVVVSITLVLPLWTEKPWFPRFAVLCILTISHLSGPAGVVMNIIGVADPLYCIYIV